MISPCFAAHSSKKVLRNPNDLIAHNATHQYEVVSVLDVQTSVPGFPMFGGCFNPAIGGRRRPVAIWDGSEGCD
jgi:hypothetical protein